MTDSILTGLGAMIARDHAAQIAAEADDPSFAKRNAIWGDIDANMETMISTPALTMEGLKAKVRVCQLIPSDPLMESLFSDILAL